MTDTHSIGWWRGIAQVWTTFNSFTALASAPVPIRIRVCDGRLFSDREIRFKITRYGGAEIRVTVGDSVITVPLGGRCVGPEHALYFNANGARYELTAYSKGKTKS